MFSQNSAYNFESECIFVLCCVPVNYCISTLDDMFEYIFSKQIMKNVFFHFGNLILLLAVAQNVILLNVCH